MIDILEYAINLANKMAKKRGISPCKVANQKKKFTRAIRKQLKTPQSCHGSFSSKYTLQFGSMNVRGLDVSAEHAIHQIIQNRQLDVSKIAHTGKNTLIVCLLR